MKYLCLGYFNPKKMDARSEKEIETIMSECHPHLENLYNSGQVLIDAGLDSKVKYLQRKNGKVEVLDSPLIKTTEMIGSAFIIEAHDIEEATKLASLHPTTQVEAGEQFDWRIEIRPIHYFEKRV
ncbi:YciI family protein [Bacillus sp. EAC]|uniref:YciI family protein n=1 Tax=Bacillus sp. EAC TaxID=1978338 RepID=UPI000B449487|nr:YciI family protein [Bacillus sp. EAC]